MNEQFVQIQSEVMENSAGKYITSEMASNPFSIVQLGEFNIAPPPFL